MKKAIITVLIMVLLLCAVFVGFHFIGKEETEKEPPTDLQNVEHDIEVNVPNEYTLYDDIDPSPTPLTCITIPTKLVDLKTKQEVTLEDLDARELEAFLVSRSYDDGMCKCMPEYVISNSRVEVSLNISQLYARFGGSQTDITAAQAERIKRIIDKYFQ